MAKNNAVQEEWLEGHLALVNTARKPEHQDKRTGHAVRRSSRAVILNDSAAHMWALLDYGLNRAQIKAIYREAITGYKARYINRGVDEVYDALLRTGMITDTREAMVRGLRAFLLRVGSWYVLSALAIGWLMMLVDTGPTRDALAGIAGAVAPWLPVPYVDVEALLLGFLTDFSGAISALLWIPAFAASAVTVVFLCRLVLRDVVRRAQVRRILLMAAVIFYLPYLIVTFDTLTASPLLATFGDTALFSWWMSLHEAVFLPWR
jgi:hypothetical protein